MRVIILSVTAGQGHNSCGNSVQAALESNGAQCEMIDTVAFINKFAGDVTNKGYLAMGKLTPKLWKHMFLDALQLSKEARFKALRSIPAIYTYKLLEYILDFNPDCIVCTHVFPSLMVSHWRLNQKISIPVIGINTDFMLHPFWEEVDQDYMVLACDKMDYSAMQRGIAKKQILPWGIPVHEKFEKPLDKTTAREELGLQDKSTILLMSGSMGFGDMSQTVLEINNLPNDAQICVVCGSNEKAYNSIVALNLGRDVVAYGYTDKIDTLMHASDIICTKPGGLSVSEALCIGDRPIVLTPPIPGLEDFNSAFLVNCGAVVQTGKYYSIQEAIYNLLTNPARMEDMLRAQQSISPRGSAQKLANFIYNLTQ